MRGKREGEWVRERGIRFFYFLTIITWMEYEFAMNTRVNESALTVITSYWRAHSCQLKTNKMVHLWQLIFVRRRHLHQCESLIMWVLRKRQEKQRRVRRITRSRCNVLRRRWGRVVSIVSIISERLRFKWQWDTHSHKYIYKCTHKWRFTLFTASLLSKYSQHINSPLHSWVTFLYFYLHCFTISTFIH